MSEKSDALAVPVDVTMRRPTLFGVPAMPILAAPLVVRRAQVEEAGALAALLGRAFEAESWDAAGTERELFCDETGRATLVVAAEGRLVATASLQVRPDVPECGWVNWVATDLDRRREGLGRALVIGVLAMAGQAGCREARLHTRTDRSAAIPLYLQLGFEPLVRGDPEREVRERVKGAIVCLEVSPIWQSPGRRTQVGAALAGSWPGASRRQLRDFAGWMCAAAPCTMTAVSTGSR